MILKSVYQDLPGGFSAVVFEELPPALILHHWVKSQKCGRGHKFVASAGMCLLDSFQNYCEVKKKKKAFPLITPFLSLLMGVVINQLARPTHW